MPNQFESDGVAYAAELPLHWAPLHSVQPAQAEQWLHQTAALLRALAVIETPLSDSERDLSSPHGKAMERLEAKLDLALSLMMQLAREQTELPAPHPAVLRARSLEWSGEPAPEPGSLIVIFLHVSPKLPHALTLPAQVIAVEPRDGGVRIRANFTHLNQEVEEWLERTVFRFHRRAIQQQHSRQSAPD